jgi:NAD(P)H-nitrite reductase large subunit
MTENSDDRIICDCTGTRHSKILELIKRGESTLARIEDITGANTGCGSCDADIQKLLDENSKNTST